MPAVLVEEINPYRTRRASLLAEDGSVYLYLAALSGNGDDLDAAAAPTVSAVWVANLGPAPDKTEAVSGLASGHPPLMGRDGTAFPLGCPPLRSPLELVWFEEGDGVALVDADGLLAVIPGWAGTDQFCGYARYCRRQSSLAWPLGSEARTQLDGKVDAARAFWSWRTAGGWGEVEASGLAHLDDRIGPREAVWRVDAGEFPEMMASRHRLGDQDVWVTSTTGLSAQRMPQVDQFASHADVAARIELAVARPTPDATARDAVVGPASIPFHQMTWLGEGHVIDGQAETNASFGPDIAGVLLTAHPPPGPASGPAVPDLSGLRRRDEPVTWLWVIALDVATLDLARRASPTAALHAFASAGRTWVQ